MSNKHRQEHHLLSTIRTMRNFAGHMRRHKAKLEGRPESSPVAIALCDAKAETWERAADMLENDLQTLECKECLKTRLRP